MRFKRVRHVCRTIVLASFFCFQVFPSYLLIVASRSLQKFSLLICKAFRPLVKPENCQFYCAQHHCPFLVLPFLCISLIVWFISWHKQNIVCRTCYLILRPWLGHILVPEWGTEKDLVWSRRSRKAHWNRLRAIEATSMMADMEQLKTIIAGLKEQQ